MKNLVLLVVTLCAVVYISSAYPSGSPKCSSHVPKHQSSKAQTSKAPYKIATSAVSKKDGKSTVTVTITGNNDTKFKGFFLYASKTNSNDKVGKFSKADKTKVLTCGSSSAITHSDNSDKSSVAITWTAPEDFSGDVEFTATIVKEFKEFWTGLKSTKVTIA